LILLKIDQATDFSALKMFKLQYQFNNIVETTQLTSDLISEFRCYCEWSKCPLPAPRSDTSLQSLNLRSLTVLSIGPCGRLPQIT